ncbi:hypothetical protein GCK32_004506 [Trichostrongylus colubriformis]|uniref:Uncharacterized protein n=1 Tax=Trichostrongylus colubriformis TaxID=6319 RepID=A0AAN8EZ13_TRICO
MRFKCPLATANVITHIHNAHETAQHVESFANCREPDEKRGSRNNHPWIGLAVAREWSLFAVEIEVLTRLALTGLSVKYLDCLTGLPLLGVSLPNGKGRRISGRPLLLT